MKLSHIALALSTLVTSTVSFAGTLSGSSNVTFLVFDGQKVKSSTKLVSTRGMLHQAVIEVSSIYRAGSDDAFFESKPIVVRFKGSDENIVIKAPKLTSESDINKFKKSPNLRIETASGKLVEFKQDYLKGEGFLPNSNILGTLTEYNQSGREAAVVAPLEASIPTSATTVNKTNKVKLTVQGENIAEQQLQYWFQQADKETQKRFLDWAKKQ